MSMFTLHPQLAKDTVWVTDLALCKVLLMNDAQYPWLILVPQLADLREIYELNSEQRQMLWEESDQVSRVLVQVFNPIKLNIAALGNMVPQLHIHHIARFTTDPAWPAPVWGKVPAQSYEATVLESRLSQLREALA
ncbi:MAG: HIT family protein [Thiofilum sp.]|uniref:HIT domain-containing protein n=1 Tax=Thiofilum sp. TaxID=2212733 RepID=UPI002600CD11|nr:HIT family protein [Thiofilum sp.]MBK8452611.1 HIT domain-containing protein [Thiofilum sp.]